MEEEQLKIPDLVREFNMIPLECEILRDGKCLLGKSTSDITDRGSVERRGGLNFQDRRTISVEIKLAKMAMKCIQTFLTLCRVELSELKYFKSKNV